MKKLLALIMVLVLALCMFACGGKKGKTVECWDCGEDVAKSADFCEYCGADLNDEPDDDDNDDPSSTNKTTNRSTNKTTTAKKTTTSKKTTTTSKKTTTTTTARMTTSSYSAYDTLALWLMYNGTYDDGEYSCTMYTSDGYSYYLVYEYADDEIRASSYNSEYDAYCVIYLDDYFYGFLFGEEQLYGYVSAGTYTETSSLTYSTYESEYLTPSDMLPVAKSGINSILWVLESYLSTKNVGVDLYDLGFKKFD